MESLFILGYALGLCSWSALRRAVAGPSCREQGWYYYSRNGSRRAVRSPGAVALAVLAAAREAGWTGPQAESASWCTCWPRTKCSEAIEAEGEDACWDALAYLRDTAAPSGGLEPLARLGLDRLGLEAPEEVR